MECSIGWRWRLAARCLTAAGLCVSGAALAYGQHQPQATVTVPFNQAGSGFSEQIGTNWGFNVGNHFFFNFNGGAPAPPFGGFVPGAGLQTGLGIVNGPGGFNGHFNLTAGQGAQTSLVGQSITTTMPSAVPASLADTSQAPFVLGAVPVVGDQSTSPLAERIERMKEGGGYGPREGRQRSAAAEQSAADPGSNLGTGGGGAAVPSGGPSTATQPPAGSVAQLAALRAAAEQTREQVQQQELEAIVAKAREAEAAGKSGQARIYYRQAAARAASPLKEQLLDRAAHLPTASAKATAPRQN